MTQRSLGRRWSATTAPYLVLRGAGQGAEFIGWILLARHLGAAAFGALAVAALVCRYGGLIADWGASISGARDVASGLGMLALDRRRQQTGVVLGAIYVAGALVTGHRDLAILVTMLLGIGLNRDWVSLGREHGARAAAPTFVQGLLLAGLAARGSVSDPALAVSVAYGVSLVLSLLLNRLPPGSAAARRVDGWMLLALLSNQVLSSADTFLLASLASISVAGVYAAVYRLPNGWLALLVILRGGLLPLAASTLRDEPERFGQLCRSARRWGVMGGAALVLLIPAAFASIPVVFGSAYRSGQWPAVILLLATAVATAGAPLHHLFLAFGDDRPYGWYLFGAAALNLVVNLALIPIIDMTGAALATLAANVFLYAVLARALQDRIRGVPHSDGQTRDAQHDQQSMAAPAADVIVVRLGRRVSMGEQRRTASWRAIGDGAHLASAEIDLLRACRARVPSPSQLVRLIRGRVVPEALTWSPRKLRQALSEAAPQVVVFVTSRTFLAPVPAGAVGIYDYVDRLSLSYRDRARLSTSWLGRVSFRILAAAHARVESRAASLPGRAVAAGAADAAALSVDYVPVLAMDPGEPDDPDVDVLFVGTLDYPPNVAAVQELAARWPDIRRLRPSVTVAVAGARPTPPVRALVADNGWSLVEDFEDARAVYARARIAVAPLNHTAGIQTKVIDAAALGVAQVVYAAALAGLPDGLPAVIADPSSFASAVVDLLGDDARRDALAAEAQAWIMDHFGRDRWAAWLGTVIAASRSEDDGSRVM